MCPIEFELLKQTAKTIGRIPADLIESISYASDNPAFRTTEFRVALVDYRKYGLRTPNAVQFNLDEEISAIKKRINNGVGLF